MKTHRRDPFEDTIRKKEKKNPTHQLVDDYIRFVALVTEVTCTAFIFFFTGSFTSSLIRHICIEIKIPYEDITFLNKIIIFIICIK